MSARGGPSQGTSTHLDGHAKVPSRVRVTEGMSSCSGGQQSTLGTSAKPSREGVTKGMSTRSGSKSAAPSGVGVAQGMSARSNDEPLTQPKGGATYRMSTQSRGKSTAPSKEVSPNKSSSKESIWGSEDKCRGCDFNKKSLRGHLARTSKDCKSFYSKEELIALEEKAKAIEKEQRAQWKKDHREAANEHERRRYHKSDMTQEKGEKCKTDFICNICDKKLASKSNLDRHVDEVHSQASLQCPHCPKVFFRNYHLIDHVDSAHKERSGGTSTGYQHHRPTECSDCKIKFTRAESKDRHYAEQHSSISLRLTCKICEKEFSRQENLNTHISAAHAGFKGFTCPKCSQCFSQKGSLNRHVAEVHLKEKKWPCDQCSMKFPRWDTLQRHLYTVTHTYFIEGGCPHCKENPSFKSRSERDAHFIMPKASDGHYKESCVTVRKRMEDENKAAWEKIKRLKSEIHYCPVCKKQYKGYVNNNHVWKTTDEPMCDTLFWPYNKEFGLKRSGVLEFSLSCLLCGCGCKALSSQPSFHY